MNRIVWSAARGRWPRAFLAGLAAAALGTAAVAQPTAKLDAGVVQGVASGDLVVYRGIPYAAPPVGPLRWRAPQPVAPWTGVRPATAFGAACLQPHLSDSR